MEEIVKDNLKCAPNIVGNLYTDLAQPGVQALGKALGNVFEFCLVAPSQFMAEKAKLNFKKRLDEYKEKLEAIPIEKQCEVQPEIGVPIIEKLYHTTNDEIADFFTTLLASASNIDMVSMAHPSFISMIERLSVDEARIIKYLVGKRDIQYCDFRAKVKEGPGFDTIIEHATLVPYEINLDFPTNISAYYENLISLGILYDNAGLYRIDQTIYNKIKEKYNYEALKAKLVPMSYKDIKVVNSYYKVTDFGKLFIKACVK